jgi:hypothetical protein
MMVTKKKDKKNSVSDLVEALNKFIYLLEGQKEDEAAEDLRIACRELQNYLPGSSEFTTAINLIHEAFEGEHDLKVYTIRRERADDGWSEAEELYLASINVLNLARRFFVK